MYDYKEKAVQYISRPSMNSVREVYSDLDIIIIMIIINGFYLGNIVIKYHTLNGYNELTCIHSMGLIGPEATKGNIR